MLEQEETNAGEVEWKFWRNDEWKCGLLKKEMDRVKEFVLLDTFIIFHGSLTLMADTHLI